MIGRGRPGVASLFCDLPTRWTAHAWNRISPRLSFADHFLEPVIDDVLAVFASTLGDCVHKTQIFSSRIVLKRFSWASLKAGWDSRSRLVAFLDRPLDFEIQHFARHHFWWELFESLRASDACCRSSIIAHASFTYFSSSFSVDLTTLISCFNSQESSEIYVSSIRDSMAINLSRSISIDIGVSFHSLALLLVSLRSCFVGRATKSLTIAPSALTWVQTQSNIFNYPVYEC